MKQITFSVSFLLLSSLTMAQQLQTNYPNVNGTVYAIAKDSIKNLLYIGGNFSSLSYEVSYGALIDTTSGLPNLSYPRPNGDVSCVVSDGKRGWFIGGSFTKVGGVNRNRLAHIDSIGNVTSWNPNANGIVNTIAVSGNTVYAGGGFDRIGGQTRNYLAAINATTGDITQWNPNANQNIRTITAYENKVYVGGVFTTVGGQARNRIAALDTSTGNATSWNPNLVDSIYGSGSINVLAALGSTIYVAGSFTSIGGQTRNNNFAALDTSIGNATSLAPNINGSVTTFTVLENTIYAAVSSLSTQVVTIDATTGNAVALSPKIYGGSINTLAVSGNSIYLGGTFDYIGGQKRKRLGVINATTGNITTFESGADSSITALAISGNTIYVGGKFKSIDFERSNIACVDANTGAVTSWYPSSTSGSYIGHGTNGTVWAIALQGNNIFLGGTFTELRGTPGSYLARVSYFNDYYSVSFFSVNNTVRTMAVANNRLYVGGQFTSVLGQTRNGIAAIDNPSDETYRTLASWNPSATGSGSPTIRGIAVSGNKIFVGGAFSNIGGQARNHLAAIDTSTGNATAWNPALSPISTIQTLSSSGNTIYVGGTFTNIGGQARSYIAALDTSVGNATSWNAGTTIVNPPYTIVKSGSTIFVGGAQFLTTNGGKNIASLDANTGNLKTTWDINMQTKSNSTIWTFLVSDKLLHIGGSFDTINLETRKGLAVYKNNNTRTINASICDGKSYNFNGLLLTTAGTYNDTLLNNFGGDSVITLNLSVKPVKYSTISISTCKSYTLNGKTYTLSNTYHDTIPNAQGCDSIITLNLTIKQPTSSAPNVSTCSSYNFNGTILTANGTYKDTLINSAGCDSIITLILTLNNSSSSHNAAICFGSSYTFNGKTYTTNKTYHDTIPNVNGCDSIMTLNLTVNPLPNPVITRNGNILSTTAFSSYQWIKDNSALSGATSQTYAATASGNYSVSVTNANTCSDTSAAINIDFTGINDISKSTFSIYPNPTKGELNITAIPNATIQIFSLHGQEIHKDTMQNETLILNLKTVPKGLYFVRLTAMSGEILVRKVVVE